MVGTDYSRSQLEKIILEVTAVPISLVPGELNLEDVFIALTQHRNADE